MKGIIIVDIPVDESCEIDEYGMVADLEIYPLTLTDRNDLNFKLNQVDIRPFGVKEVKSGNRDFIIYQRDYLYEHLDREIEMLKEGKKFYESNNCIRFKR